MSTAAPAPAGHGAPHRRVLEALPLAAELYWWRNRNRFQGYYSLHAVEAHAAELKAATSRAAQVAGTGKKIHLFASWFYWIDYCAVLGMAFAGQGHRVSLAYLPYASFKQSTSRFNRRVQELYTQSRLGQLRPWLRPVSLLRMRLSGRLPQELQQAVERIAEYDTLYIQQTEDVDPGSDLHQLRRERDLLAARAALEWLKKDRPDVIVLPNGSIQEYAIVYQVARYLGIPVTTFEFSMNKEELWLSQDVDIMQQNTDLLWKQCGSRPLSGEQLERIQELERARMGARPFGNIDWLWQNVPTHGGEQVRKALGLDDRPVVLIATNVLGDSLTINRHLFASSMTEWITRTIRFFADHPEVQLLVRIHPGERLSTGPSMLEAARAAVEVVPEHIHLIGPYEKVNTYDLMELSSLGLVYTTTAGLEMALNSIPVIVAGRTHYRSRGFTIDVNTWEEYFQRIQEVIQTPALQRLSAGQAELAWRYAYLFFFVYTLPFPWKLVGFMNCLEKWPLERVLGPEGHSRFGKAFRYLAGEPIDWTSI